MIFIVKKSFCITRPFYTHIPVRHSISLCRHCILLCRRSICEENAFYTYGTHSILINGIGLCECNMADLYATIAYSI